MLLIHDDDLKKIDGIGDGTVSEYLIGSYSLLIPRSTVT
jgi:hypothetical protein